MKVFLLLFLQKKKIFFLLRSNIPPAPAINLKHACHHRVFRYVIPAVGKRGLA